MVDLTLSPSDAAAPASPRERLLAHLREAGLADGAAIARAEQVASRTGQSIEQVLNQLGNLSDADLATLYAEVTGLEIWDPLTRRPSPALETLGVSEEYLRRAHLLPIEDDGQTLVCAACDPLDEQALSGVVFATGRRVQLLIAKPADWRRAFEQTFERAANDAFELDERRLEREIDLVSDSASEGSGSRVVAAAFEAAIAAGASDIHFEPKRHELAIRLRVDGRLIDYRTVSADLAAPTVSRVKVIANLDLGERRLPQDGRTTFVIGGKQVDVRVATSPTVFGESAVLRILDRSNVELDLDALGLSAPMAQALRRAAKAPHGMFLITGPTGSGKTTTLYALLQTFAGSQKKVLSVEDPVEYHFEHVTQTQVAPQLGLTFAAALRSFLRQDPDVILVGEIRDPETAAVAVQAAMTGHFVLASVHANSALAVLPRLQDMGIEPYQMAAGFRGAAAQRLVRRLCPDCRRRRDPTRAEVEQVGAAGLSQPAYLFEAVGCPRCKNLGFRGRIPIGEIFLSDEDLLRAIADRRPMSEVAGIAERLGLASMAADGFDKAARGLTTYDEVTAAIDG